MGYLVQGVNIGLLLVVLVACVYHALFTRCEDVMAAAKLLVGAPLGLSASGVQRPTSSIGSSPTIAPTVAADLFSKGNAAHARGDLETAASLFTQAFRAFPAYGLAYTNLGNIYLQQNQVRLALQTHSVALQYRERDARAWYNVAVCHHRLGQLSEAKRHYAKALSLQPDYANALYNLALAEQDNHELGAAAGHYTELLALDPAHVDGRVNLCNVLLAQQLDFAVVEKCYRDTLSLFPNHAKTAVNLASLYHSHAASPSSSAADDMSAAYASQAAAYYKQALSLDPSNIMAQHGLRSVTGGEGEARRGDLKAEYVAELFDSYSFHFDESLAQLQYRAHTLVAEAAMRHLLSPKTGVTLKARVSVADLGCGTGLVCSHLRSGFKAVTSSPSSLGPSESSPATAASLPGGDKPVLDIVGVDLSPKMIQKAQTKGCYDKAVTGEVVAVVSELPPASLHAAVAADVVCYFGALAPLLSSVHLALTPGGVFTFTVETGADPTISAELEKSCSFALQFSGRFAHSECAVMKAATEGGWEVAESSRVVPRLDKGKEVPGLLVSLRRKEQL